MAKRKVTKRTAKKRRTQRATRTALVEPPRKVEDLPALTEEGAALAYEVGLNRKAILALGKITLDHERRIAGLEEALADLAGVEDEDLIELEAEPEEGSLDEAVTQRLAIADLAGVVDGKDNANKKRKPKGKKTQRARRKR